MVEASLSDIVQMKVRVRAIQVRSSCRGSPSCP